MVDGPVDKFDLSTQLVIKIIDGERMKDNVGLGGN